MPKLTVATVAKLIKANEPGRYADGQNLYLKIIGGRACSVSWTFMWKRGTKQTEIGLGSATGKGKAGKVSLALARDKADAIHHVIARGGDPLAEKRRETGVTFGACASALIETLKPGWRHPKSEQDWTRTLLIDAKALVAKPVANITLADVEAVLSPLWLSKHSTAERLRGRIERVLDYAKAKGFRSGDNPARWKGGLGDLLSKRRSLTKGRHPALPWREAGGFMTELRGHATTASRALELTILCAARSGEVLGARWEEFDLEQAVWTLPGNRMKAGVEHQVPLPPRALEIVQAMPRINEFVFAGQKRGRPLSHAALEITLKKRMARKGVTVHGFRSTFRDWAGSATHFPRETAEECLAHQLGTVERAYKRQAALDKRRALLTAWEGYLAGRDAKVVPIRAAS